MTRIKSKYKISYQHKTNIVRSNKINKFNKQKWALIKDKPISLIKQTLEEGKVYLQPRKKFFLFNLKFKKQLKSFYGNLTEKRYKALYLKAINQRKSRNTYLSPMQLFINMLERRLDIVIFRLYFASSIFNAKQLIQHGKILVNGKVITIKSYQVKNGDLIEIDKSIENNVKQNIENANYHFIPKYLECNFKLYKGIFLYDPKVEDIIYPMSINFKLLSEIKH
jgi:small subunit ribosomal protein S4